MLKWDFRTVNMQKVGESLYIGYYLNLGHFLANSIVGGGDADSGLC